MNKPALPRKILATTVAGLLLLGIAACDKGSTGCITCAGDFEPNLADATLSISTTSLPHGIENAAYSQAVSVLCTRCSTPYTWSVTVGSLPTGLSLGPTNPDHSTFITGTPTVVGTWDFTVRIVGEDGRSRTQPLSIGVDPEACCPDGPAGATSIKGTITQFSVRNADPTRVQLHGNPRETSFDRV